MSPQQLSDLCYLAMVSGVVGGASVVLALHAVVLLGDLCAMVFGVSRGMGQRPMSDFGRATYPAPSGGECPARPGAHVSASSVLSGISGRWIKRGADPRPGGSPLPGAHSRLEDNVPQALPARASGADRG